MPWLIQQCPRSPTCFVNAMGFVPSPSLSSCLHQPQPPLHCPSCTPMPAGSLHHQLIVRFYDHRPLRCWPHWAVPPPPHLPMPSLDKASPLHPKMQVGGAMMSHSFFCVGDSPDIEQTKLLNQFQMSPLRVCLLPYYAMIKGTRCNNSMAMAALFLHMLRDYYISRYVPLAHFLLTLCVSNRHNNVLT